MVIQVGTEVCRPKELMAENGKEKGGEAEKDDDDISLLATPWQTQAETR